MPDAARLGRAFAIQDAEQYQSTKTIADQHIPVRDGDGATGLLLCHASRALDMPSLGIERLLVVVHGALRDSDRYLAHAEAAAGNGGSSTLIVAPQFLANVDLGAHAGAPDSALYWE